MGIFKKKRAVDIGQIIENELALARRGGYLFGIIVVKSHKNIFDKSIESIINERVRAYDYVQKIDKKSYIVILRRIENEDVKNISVFFEEKMNKIYIDYYVYPVCIDGMKSVLEYENNDFRNSIYKVKRVSDIVLSFCMITVLFPLYILIAFMVKISSVGPVIFKQERIGYMGKRFIMYKFRTMYEDVSTQEHELYLKKIIEDCRTRKKKIRNMKKMETSERIFPVGRFLRKYCLDELPQLFNVLKGEMSIVGPRPPVRYEVEEYEDWYKERFDIYPGITGLWQVSGKNNLDFERMIKLDILYKKKYTIVNDIKIICMTPLVILKQFV